MANKLAVITQDDDDGAWLIMWGIHEVAKRHPGKIDVDHIKKLKLGDLEDSEMLYILGHGSPVDIVGGYNGKKLSDILVKNGLPKDKKVRIRLLSCETGLYANILKTSYVGGTGDNDAKIMQFYESFTKDFKNALTSAKCSSCTLEVPLGSVTTLGAKEGDHVIKPKNQAAAKAKCAELFQLNNVHNALFEVNKKVQEDLEKPGLLALADKVANLAPVKSFTNRWKAYAPQVLYKDNKGWRIVSP